MRDQKLTTNFNSNFKFGKPDDDISLRVNPIANLFYARPPIARNSSDSSSCTDDSSRDADLNDNPVSVVLENSASGSIGASNMGNSATNISVKVCVDGVNASSRGHTKRARKAKATKREQIVAQPSTSGIPSRKRSRTSTTGQQMCEKRCANAPNIPNVTSSGLNADSSDFQCKLINIMLLAVLFTTESEQMLFLPVSIAKLISFDESRRSPSDKHWQCPRYVTLPVANQ